MADLDDAKNNPRKLLFEQLDSTRTGMLGVMGSDQHPQPMTHHGDAAEQAIWFITSLSSDLVRAVGMGGMGEFVLIGDSHDYFASIRGPITQEDNSAKLDEIWSEVAAAWFEGGREDPDVCLLKLACNEAATWASTKNPVWFGIEIARASLEDHHQPDLGRHIVINFADEQA